jgi:hypothetical protein
LSLEKDEGFSATLITKCPLNEGWWKRQLELTYNEKFVPNPEQDGTDYTYTVTWNLKAL